MIFDKDKEQKQNKIELNHLNNFSFELLLVVNLSPTKFKKQNDQIENI